MYFQCLDMTIQENYLKGKQVDFICKMTDITCMYMYVYMYTVHLHGVHICALIRNSSRTNILYSVARKFGKVFNLAI